MWLLPWLFFWRPEAAPCYIDNSSFPSQGVKLRLMKRSWLTHQLVTEAAAILLREALRYDVEVVAPREHATAADFEQIALGHYDANFEVWPQAKHEIIRDFKKKGQGRIAGVHTTPSHSGVYTMKYTVEQSVEAKFYQHLRTPEIYSAARTHGEQEADPSGLCLTSAWNCSNFTWRPATCSTSSCGTLLHDMLGYMQGQIEQQISNHQLPLQVAYLTTPSLSAEVWEAFATRKPLLFQANTPSEGWAGIAMEHFVPVQFPPLNCDNRSSGDPTGPLSCGTPEQPLLKVISPALEASPDALRFATVFDLRQEDYDKLIRFGELHKHDSEAAACAWLHHVGRERWGDWIHFSNSIRMVESFPPTQGCFPALYIFSLLALVSFLLTRAISILMHRRRAVRTKAKDSIASSDLEQVQRQMHSRACQTHVDLTSKLVGTSSKKYVAVKWALLKGRMSFMGFFRSEEDFCQPLGYGMSPPDASSGLRQLYHTKLEVLIYIFTSGFAKTLMSALIYTFVAGAVGALLSEVNKTVQMNEHVDPEARAETPYLDFLSSMRTVSVIVDGFDFLPVFLITYMVGQDVSRWHEWLQKMLQLQGRLHDMVLIVNSSYRHVNDPVRGFEQRKAIFKWYRYFNAVHYLGYLNLVPSIGTAEQALQELQTVGLLNAAECDRLRFASQKVRDTLTSWLGKLWHDELEAKNVQPDETYVFMQKLCDLRSILAGLNDMPCKAPPQMVRIMMVIVTNILLTLSLLGYPAKMYQSTNACVQFWPLLACFLYFICYRGMLHVMFTLDKGPFYAKGECVNVDALLISTERFAYHVFRSHFDTSRRSPTSSLSLSPK